MNTAGRAAAQTGSDCAGGATVWFSYRAEVSQRLAATTLGSGYDTVLYAARRNNDLRIDWDHCNDDAGSGQHSAVVFDAVAGATYLFRVASFDAAGGPLVFNLGAAPPPIVLWVTPSPEGTFDRNGNALVSGTVTCSGGTGDVYINLVLRQRVDRVVVEGYGNAEVADCSSRPRAWASRIEGAAGTFGEEPATLNADGWVCGNLECVSGAAFIDVTLSSDDPPPRPSPSPMPTASPSPSPTPASTTTPSPSPSPSALASLDSVALDATQSPPAP